MLVLQTTCRKPEWTNEISHEAHMINHVVSVVVYSSATQQHGDSFYKSIHYPIGLLPTKVAKRIPDLEFIEMSEISVDEPPATPGLPPLPPKQPI